MKRALKWKFSSLMDHSVTFTQICPTLLLYAKWAEIKPIPESSTITISEMKIVSKIDHFVILLKLTQHFFQFLKWGKLKLAK